MKFAVSQPPALPWVIGTGLHTLDQFVDQLLSDEDSSPGLWPRQPWRPPERRVGVECCVILMNLMWGLTVD